MERIEGLSIGLDLETMKVDSGLKDLKSKLTLVNSEMKANLSAFDRSEKSVGKYETRLNGLNKKIEVQRAVTENARKTYSKMVDEFGEGSKEAEKAASEYNKQSSNLQNLERYIDRTKDALEKLKEEQRIANSNWTKMGQQMSVAGDKMQKFGRGMTDFGKSYTMGVTAPIVASGVAVFKAASDYESAFAGVAKTFSGTEQQLADLRVGIRDMAKEIPASTTEIAAVAEAAGQLGIKAESIEEFTRTMIDLGEATNMTSDQAATEFARFANIVGMYQDDFDKMGSSIVALGNSMATTEAEISSMAMELAAQGKQVGMTEAQILALSGTMSSLGIEAEAGGTAMTTVLKKIDSAVDESDVMLDEFAKTARMSSSEFAKVWEDEPIEALDMFIKGLAESSSEGANLTAILGDLGIKGIRESDTILRLAGASDLLTDAVNTSTKAWEENTALSDEAAQRYATTESKLKILWNRAKDMAITTGEALVPAVMDLLDASEPLIKKIEEGAQAFADMSEEEQQTILKTIALVAAIGPAAIGIGHLTTGIGGLLKVGGGVATMLGKVGGKGLLGRIAGFGMGGPVGLAVGGVTLLAGGIYALSQASKDNLEETAKNIEKRREEIASLDESIARYEELQGKNKLTTDEVLRYMDIMDELKKAKNENTIAALKDEQAELAEKSGMTNDEIEEFLGLNDTIVKNSPSTVAAISDQGNAYAETADVARELNDIEKERLSNDLYNTITSQIDQHIDNLKDQEKYQQRILELEKEREGYNSRVIESGRRLVEIDKELLGLDAEQVGLTIEQRDKIRAKIAELESERQQHEFIIQDNNEEIAQADKKIEKQKEKLDGVNTEISLYNDMLLQYESMLLAEKNIVDEKGNAYESIENAKKSLHDQRMEQIRLFNAGKITNEEYEKAIGKINDQETAIGDVQVQADILNEKLSQEIKKNVGVSTNPSIDKLNRDLASSLTKRINIDARVNGAAAISPYAKGTPPGGHPGGLAVVGDGGGSELIHTPDGRSFLSPSTDTIMDLPKGTHVIPHEKTKRLLSFTPKYAGGTRNWESLFNLDNANSFMKLLALIGKGIGNDSPPASTGGGEIKELISLMKEFVNKAGEIKEIHQDITIISPEPTSPSENARKFKQASRQMAMEL